MRQAARLFPDRQIGRQAMSEGRPCVLDVRIEKRFGGAESTWYDFFSVAKKTSRQT